MYKTKKYQRKNWPYRDHSEKQKNGLQPILQWENVKTTGILYDSLYDSEIQNKRLTSYMAFHMTVR